MLYYLDSRRALVVSHSDTIDAFDTLGRRLECDFAKSSIIDHSICGWNRRLIDLLRSKYYCQIARFNGSLHPYVGLSDPHRSGTLFNSVLT